MKHPIHNAGLSPLFIAGVMIMSGETRHFDVDQLPPEHRPPAPDQEVAPPADHIAELAEQNAKSVVAALPELSSEDLARLQIVEDEGKARKTVLEAIAAEGLKRAQSTADEASGDKSPPAPVVTPEGTAGGASGENPPPAPGATPEGSSE